MNRNVLSRLLTIIIFSVSVTEMHAQIAKKVMDNVTSYQLRTEGGTTIDIARLKGKVLFLNFWALSCLPCKTELPTINALQQHFKTDTDVVFFATDLDNTMAESNRFMREKGLDLTVYIGIGQLPKALFHGVLPTTVIIDKKGRIVFFHEEADDYSTKKYVDYLNGLRKE